MMTTSCALALKTATTVILPRAGQLVNSPIASSMKTGSVMIHVVGCLSRSISLTASRVEVYSTPNFGNNIAIRSCMSASNDCVQRVKMSDHVRVDAKPNSFFFLGGGGGGGGGGGAGRVPPPPPPPPPPPLKMFCPPLRDFKPRPL